jgi:ribosomal protein S18 acetylase RimI-like enzyme
VAGIRRYRPADRDALREVCVRTARAGGDARGLFTDDRLWADIFLDPYLEFEPDLAFVIETDGAAVGYIVATADTARFVERYREEWMPRLAQRHPRPPAGLEVESAESLEVAITRLAFHPDRMLRDGIEAYPAHLHIDLLPEAQGRGWGRALVDRLLVELAGRGIQGVHLGMDPANTGARAFYLRLGFAELPGSSPEDPLLGIATAR